MKHIRQDPADPEFVQNPYRFYDRARALGEIVFWEDYDLPVAISHRAVGDILKDKRLGREPLMRPDVPDHLSDFYAVEAHSMLEREPPTHTRLRGNVVRAFTSSRIQRLAPDIVELADGLIARFPNDAPFDLLESFAEPLPVTVIARLLGMPEDMGPSMRNWSNRMVAMYQAGRTEADEHSANTAAAEFAAFVGDYVAMRRNSPSDDLISALIAAETEGARLNEGELITTVILLMNAGHEATVHTIGNGVSALLSHGFGPETLTPAFVGDTVEEILRFDPPLHMFTRHVYEDCQIAGCAFQRGDEIGCLLAAANRDPAVFSDPNTFDPTRPANRHQAFGAGIHFCVGAPLARLELQIALPILFARCPDLALDGAPSYANTYHFHGLDALRVRTNGPLTEATLSST